MSGSAKADAKAVRSSMGTPKWIALLGTGMFSVGGLTSAVGILSGNALLACAGLVFMVIGAMSMANTYTASVRADLLQRIETLERRLSNEVDT
jgi:hypothetical protein